MGDNRKEPTLLFWQLEVALARGDKAAAERARRELGKAGFFVEVPKDRGKPAAGGQP